MPTCSVYLDDETLSAIKDLSKQQDIPLSQVVQNALAQYLRKTGRPLARERVLETLRARNPFGKPADWEGTHRERTDADESRG